MFWGHPETMRLRIIIEKDHVSNKITLLQEVFDLIILEFENYLTQKLYLKSSQNHEDDVITP